MNRFAIALWIFAGMSIAAGIVFGLILGPAFIYLMYLAIPFHAVALALYDYHPNKYIESRYEAKKITTGRFKGKMLMAEYDVEQIEREVLSESVEAMLERKLKYVEPLTPTASTLAQHTIERIDDLLDPLCNCRMHDPHRKSGHDQYIAEMAAINARKKCEAELERKKNKQIAKTYKNANKDVYYLDEDYSYYNGYGKRVYVR